MSKSKSFENMCFDWKLDSNSNNIPAYLASGLNGHFKLDKTPQPVQDPLFFTELDYQFPGQRDFFFTLEIREGPLYEIRTVLPGYETFSKLP